MTVGFQRVDERFEKQDGKIDELRRETKADFQRVDESALRRSASNSKLTCSESKTAPPKPMYSMPAALSCLKPSDRELEDRRERL